MNFNTFYQEISQNRLSHWLNTLPAQLTLWQKQELHGEFAKWQKTLDALPKTAPSTINLQDGVIVGDRKDINDFLK